MRKNEEIINPNSCLNRALNTELIFILLGRDTTAPAAIRFWCKERINQRKNNPNDAQIIDALNLAERMEKECKP